MTDIINMIDSFPYHDEVNYLSLSKMRTWEGAFIQCFQYDDVMDEQIAKALADLDNINAVNPDIDWEDDAFLAHHEGIPDNEKHAYRVAAIVKTLQDEPCFKHPIEFDTYSNGQCGFCVPNGHHRVRAADFLKIDVVPFSLNGDLNMIDELVELAGYEPSPSATLR